MTVVGLTSVFESDGESPNYDNSLSSLDRPPFGPSCCTSFAVASLPADPMAASDASARLGLTYR
jgi:hypothetical protein